MAQNTEKNRKIILAERPFGAPDKTHYALKLQKNQ